MAKILIEEKKLLRVVTVPKYPSSIQIAKSIAPKYFVLADSKKRGKKIMFKTQLPKKYQDETKFKFIDGVLYNLETKQKVISNPIKTGQERLWVVNFQDIWNQNVVKQARAIRTEKLKQFFLPFFQKQFKPLSEEDYPIGINIFIYDTKMPVDISNKGVVYVKVIEDLLKSYGFIQDDDIRFVRESGRVKYIQVEKEEDIKMVITFFHTLNAPYDKAISTDKYSGLETLLINYTKDLVQFMKRNPLLSLPDSSDIEDFVVPWLKNKK